MALVDYTARPCRTHALTAATNADDTISDCCRPYVTYTSECLHYGGWFQADEPVAAHIRFDRDVTVRTNSGTEVTIAQGEHHPAEFIPWWDLPNELAELTGLDTRDDDGPAYRTAWWRIRVEWVDTSAVHTPIAYIDDHAVSLLGPWMDQHNRRHS